MNESLAKQLHDLIIGYKLNIQSDVACSMNELEHDVEKLIENNENKQENVNE